ncbi:Nodulin MtN21 /EamA-like transporter family protein isoform 2 [Hibiscus syriacus]|uniref:Nodulin MtN21 /EamA-like transporter family protein isoform 2 n=1 Tax=Hibiscus syriacus TaxID=106335 RepID=A0A6A2WWF9_HIBSY|nr:Nodulin MtN21 /EamA-like transporter family protein isoform 2 [Hibiscus syriacus]
MEKLAWKRTSSQAKVIGTMISIIGAFVLTLYKGPTIVISSAHSMSLQQSLNSLNPNWILGGLLLTAEYVLVPLCFIAAIVGLATERDSSSWRLRPDIALASVVCSGLFGSCLKNMVHTWALRLEGPVFVAMFKPLSIAIAVGMGVMFLGDTLYLGRQVFCIILYGFSYKKWKTVMNGFLYICSIIGATIISIGFYTVMWGKTNEEMGECGNESMIDSPSSHKVPLLQSFKNEQV